MITGDDLAAARNRAGLSQEALAKQLGVSLKTVNNWEAGRVQPRAHSEKVRLFIEAHPIEREPVVRTIPDEELLKEIARRLRSRTEEGPGNGELPAKKTVGRGRKIKPRKGAGNTP